MIAQGVRFRYPGAATDALGPLDLDGPAGRPWLVLGPAGSGKTTLLRLLSGQLTPTEGEITAPAGAYLPQFPERVLVGRNLAEDLVGRVRPDRDTRVRLRNALARTGLENRPLSLGNRALSGGERRQVALALLLLAERPHWALDEPDAGLDGAGRGNLLKLLEERGTGPEARLWIASHRFEMYGDLHPWVVVLDQGLVAAAGELGDVLKQKDVHRVLALGAWGPAALWVRYAGGASEDLFNTASGLENECRDRVRKGLRERAGLK